MGVEASGDPLASCGQRRCELQRQALVLQPGGKNAIDRPTAAIYGTRRVRPSLAFDGRARAILVERSRARRRDGEFISITMQ
jgi:hypothetical protein